MEDSTKCEFSMAVEDGVASPEFSGYTLETITKPAYTETEILKDVSVHTNMQTKYTSRHTDTPTHGEICTWTTGEVDKQVCVHTQRIEQKQRHIEIFTTCIHIYFYTHTYAAIDRDSNV